MMAKAGHLISLSSASHLNLGVTSTPTLSPSEFKVSENADSKPDRDKGSNNGGTVGEVVITDRSLLP